MRREQLVPKRLATDGKHDSSSEPLAEHATDASAHLAPRTQPQRRRNLAIVRGTLEHPLARRAILVLMFGLCCFTAMGVGVYIGHFHIWPYRVFSRLYRPHGSKVADARSELEFKGLPPLGTTDLARVSTPALIGARRAAV